MNTVSLRRRVTLTALLVLLVVLPITGLAVKAIFDAQSERNLNTLLNGRAQLAQQLSRENVAPAALVRRIDADGIRVTLQLRNGQSLGAPEVEPTGEIRQVRVTLQGGQRTRGATLLLSADTSLLDGASRTLQRVLLISGAAALLITALALILGMRFALAPLDAMTSLARSIAAGRRGGRLQPTRTDTELGRTAEAFDEMLDSLEGAEQTARGSEQHMRQFVADAAHELRTPVTGLQTAAETLLQLGPEATPERREELELLLVRESRRAGTLVADLLELARIDAGLVLRHRPVNLRSLAQTQVDRLHLVAPSPHRPHPRSRPSRERRPRPPNPNPRQPAGQRPARHRRRGAGQVEICAIRPHDPQYVRSLSRTTVLGCRRRTGSGSFSVGSRAGQSRFRARVCRSLVVSREPTVANSSAIDRPDGRPGAAFLLTLPTRQTLSNPSTLPAVTVEDALAVGPRTSRSMVP